MSACESLPAAANVSLHFASAVATDAQVAKLQLTNDPANEPADEHVAAHIVPN